MAPCGACVGNDEVLTDQRIMVTGAASGIGLAICQGLAKAGATLAMTDRDSVSLANTVDMFKGAAGYGAELLHADEISALVGQALADGPIHGLVNCAGLYPLTDFLDLDVDEWDEVLGVNLRAPFLLTQAIARSMVSSSIAGSVVNVSSTASTLARPGISHYAASKAGLNQLTRVLAVELAPYRIRVNAVLPGVVETERVRALGDSPEGAADLIAKQARIPLERLGRPDDVVPMVRMLLSDQTSYCTGGLFTVDGGYSLGIARV